MEGRGIVDEINALLTTLHTAPKVDEHLWGGGGGGGGCP